MRQRLEGRYFPSGRQTPRLCFRVVFAGRNIYCASFARHFCAIPILAGHRVVRDRLAARGAAHVMEEPLLDAGRVEDMAAAEAREAAGFPFPRCKFENCYKKIRNRPERNRGHFGGSGRRGEFSGGNEVATRWSNLAK